MKDNETVFRLIGASNHSAGEREATDFCSTDPDCVKDLLELEQSENKISEPCCGSGNISKVLEEAGHEVISTDLCDHGYGTSGIDLLTYKDIDCSIITNPPFGIVTEFIEHMLDNLKPGHKMALFLKLQFLEGQDRYKKAFSRKQLKTVYLCAKRVACHKNNEMYQRNEDGTFKLDKDGDKMKIPSAVAYMRAIFESGYQGDPVIKRISNK